MFCFFTSRLMQFWSNGARRFREKNKQTNQAKTKTKDEKQGTKRVGNSGVKI